MASKTKTRKELETEYVTAMQSCYTIAAELMAKHSVEPPKVTKPPKVVELSEKLKTAVTDTLTNGIESKRDLDAAICEAEGYKDANQLTVIYASLVAAGIINYEKQKSAGKGATITLA